MVDHAVRSWGDAASSAWAVGPRGVDGRALRSWLAARQREEAGGLNRQSNSGVGTEQLFLFTCPAPPSRDAEPMRPRDGVAAPRIIRRSTLSRG